MKVYVISLPEARERRKYSAEQLQRAGVNFEFFDAIRGELAIRDCLFEGFDSERFRLVTGRLVAIGEIGCFASHRALWRQSVRLNEPVVIMEDDFNAFENFAAALDTCSSLANRLGLIRLQATTKGNLLKIGQRNNFSVSRYRKVPFGLMCYCISPAAAKKFLALTKKIDAPVDEFTKKFWEHGQPMYALTPYSVAPSIMSVDSTIVGRRKTRKSAGLALRRALYKANNYLRRWRANFQLRFLSRNPLATDWRSSWKTKPGVVHHEKTQ